MSMALKLPAPAIMRPVLTILVVALIVAVAINLIWVWLTGFDRISLAVRYFHNGLIMSLFLTAASSGACVLAERLAAGKPPYVRWPAYVVSLCVAAAVGTLATYTVLYLLGAISAARIPSEFWSDLRMAMLICVSLGCGIILFLERASRNAVQIQNAGDETRIRIPSRTGGKVEFVDLDAVSYLYSEDKVTFAVSPSRHYPLDTSLSRIERQLAGRGWIRIHRKTLVNVSSVTGLHTDSSGRLFVTLSDGVELPVARDRAAKTRAKLGALLNR